MAGWGSEVQSRRDTEMHQIRSLQLIISWSSWNHNQEVGVAERVNPEPALLECIFY